MATLEDLLEEIVGEFTTDFTSRLGEVRREDDGSCIIDGSALVRDVTACWNGTFRPPGRAR